MSRRAIEESKALASVSREPRLDAQDEQTRRRGEQSSEKSRARRRAELWRRFQDRRVSMLRMSRRAAEESKALDSVSRSPRLEAQESRRATEGRRAPVSVSSSPRVHAQDEQTRHRGEQSSSLTFKIAASRCSEEQTRHRVSRAPVSGSRLPRLDAQDEQTRAAKESGALVSVSRSPRLDAQDEQTRHRGEQSSEKRELRPIRLTRTSPRAQKCRWGMASVSMSSCDNGITREGACDASSETRSLAG
jgi:hypothetical protein